MTEESTVETAAPEEVAPGAPEDPVLAGLAAAFPEAAFSRFTPPSGPSQDVVVVSREDLVGFAAAARDTGFDTFIDLCGVDHLGARPRFEVVVTLLAMDLVRRLRIRVPVPGTDPRVPTLTGVFPGANFYERETWDLFGIVFDGHTDLTRLLLPDEWEGHPLRKDEGVGSVPIQFKGARRSS